MKRGRFIFFSVMLVIGMLISLFLVYEHFSTVESEFCNLSEGFDCGIVNKSPYANVDGIFYLMTIDFGWDVPLFNLSDVNLFFDLLTSNAFLGFLTLVFAFFLVRANYKKRGLFWIDKKGTLKWLRIIFTFGVVYGGYLFLIQHSILKTYCIFCLALDAVLLTLLVTVWSVKNE